jgi:hypothetical protein
MDLHEWTAVSEAVRDRLADLRSPMAGASANRPSDNDLDDRDQTQAGPLDRGSETGADEAGRLAQRWRHPRARLAGCPAMPAIVVIMIGCKRSSQP